MTEYTVLPACCQAIFALSRALLARGPMWRRRVVARLLPAASQPRVGTPALQSSRLAFFGGTKHLGENDAHGDQYNSRQHQSVEKFMQDEVGKQGRQERR